MINFTSFEKVLLSFPKFGRIGINMIPDNILTGISHIKAVQTFKTSIKLPAFKKFITKYGDKSLLNGKKVSWEDIPVTDKESYILPFKLSDRSIPNGILFGYRSSGYSGKPVYWTQSVDEYEVFSKYVSFNMQNIFDIKRKKTLVISMFAMSSWVTGQETLCAINDMACKYKKVTYFACGMEYAEALDYIRNYGSDYEQIIIFSYPLTFKKMIDQGIEEGMNWPNLNVYAIIGAEGVTYSWCEHHNAILNKKDESKYRIISAIGSADTGIGLGSEQIFCLVLKEIFYQNPELRKDIIGLEEMPLHIFQYNPLDVYLETSKKNELLITSLKKIPLVKYNIHDKAYVTTYKKLVKKLKEYGIDVESDKRVKESNVLKLPFLFIYGRSDSTIILNGANVYINSFKEALHQKSIANYHTGKFRVKKIEEEDMFHNYKVEIELNENIKPTSELKKKFRNQIINFLTEHDRGYTAAYHQRNLNKEICIIEFVNFEGENSLKHKYND